MRKRIHENIIHIGEPLLWDLFSNDNRIMFRKGFVVRSKDNLEKILGLTLFYNDDKNTNLAENMEPSVFIKSNTTKGSRQISITTSPRKKEASSLFFEDISSMQQERNVILKFHNNEIPSPFTFFNYLDFCASQSKAIQDDILYGKLKNTAPIEALADHIIDIADTSIDACLGAIHLDHQHSISVLHPIYCAFLCIITAKKLNLPNDTIKSIVCAALTANVGMYEVFDTLFHRAGGLNDKEKQLIRNHPVKSEKMLKNIGVTDKIWLRTIIQHHERVDGRGYPKALKSSQINIESLIYSSADTYLAQILPRK
ncbi:MAG: hypothetical protein OEY00_07025, partial [Gammaproteobacteria bacterium]|nr:hypothetical protein [Gammaproteobacteria bacterium]